MVDLNDIAVFAAVAQFESFSRAARSLGMPVSTVSRKVTALEEQLGVTLIQRTTRKLSLTAQGRAYYAECGEPLKQLRDAERVLSEAQRRPEGLLRVTESNDFRMPELHGGDGVDLTGRPVPYPASCRPQAWSAAAAITVLGALR